MKRTFIKGKFRLNGTPKIRLYGESDKLITLSYWVMLETVKGIMINNNCSFDDAFDQYLEIASTNISEFDRYEFLKLHIKENNEN